MNLYYNGVDIYGDVSVNYCVHEMFAEKQGLPDKAGDRVHL